MKEKPSKLDAHAERLDDWFGVQNMTLDQVREQLLQDGVSVSASRLSKWWQNRRTRLLQERQLNLIASGAQQVREVEKAFSTSKAPELETLIKLHRVLVLDLSTKGIADPKMLELVNRMMRELRQYARLEQIGEQIALEREKFQIDAAEKCLEKLAELKTISTDTTLSQTEKVEQIRLKLFGSISE